MNQPSLARWDITTKCNLSCRHCCVYETIADPAISDLSPIDAAAVLTRLYRGGIRTVHLLGGEPTLRPDFRDLLAEAQRMGMAVSFNTNGIRQDETYIASLFSHSVTKVVVSIDGPDAASCGEIRGDAAFAKATSFVRRLVAKRAELGGGPAIQIQAVLTRSWSRRVRDMVRLCSDLRVDGLKINHLAEDGNAKVNSGALVVDPVEHFEALLSLLDCMEEMPGIRIDAPIKPLVYLYHRKLRGSAVTPDLFECPAVAESIYVGVKGDVHPCQLSSVLGLAPEGAVTRVLDLADGAGLAAGWPEEFARRVHGQAPAQVYAHQVPCNRCPCLNVICRPCPLPDKPGFHPTNMMCVIAEALMAGMNGMAPRVFDAAVARQAVADNPPRAGS